MRSKGKLTSWNDNKGYGFVAPFDGGDRVFIHIKAIKNRSRRPVVNDVVTYSVSKDERGRMQATNATLAGEKIPKQQAQTTNSIAVVFAWLFLLTVGASCFFADLPLIVVIAYILLSLITFIAYAIDKAAAQAGQWRTSESSLQLLALIGGWPGAVLAQQMLRHKSRKGSFRVVLWATVILNCAVFIWLHTEAGRAFLEHVPGVNL